MTRIYWHGVWPDFSCQGEIVRRGTVNHEVRWDSAPAHIVMLPVEVVKPVGQHKTCKCGRCGGVTKTTP